MHLLGFAIRLGAVLFCATMPLDGASNGSATIAAMPSVNAPRAVPTFESIGLYWTPPSNPGASGCAVVFRKAGDSRWREGLNLWYDARTNECRGSLVLLDPGTAYEIRIGIPGRAPTTDIIATTWNERFPIAKTIILPAGTLTRPLAIKEGGAPGAYVLYQANAAGTTIDVQNAHASAVTISAPYVILRGLTITGGRENGVELLKGAHDVVIERNDISNWGRFRYTNSSGWKIGVDMDSGIRAKCSDFSLERVVIQRNKIHDPRYTANSWDWGHPAGPQGITFSYCGGNNVFRYNEIYSTNGNFYNDPIGGEDNYTTTGFPNYDSDIYGNIFANAYDDGIEADGGNRNVRIWGNYIDQTSTAVSTTLNSVGPSYIFRNVYNRSRTRYLRTLDNDDRNVMFKSGTDSSTGEGRRYVFHNTALQATDPGAKLRLGAGSGLTGTGKNPLTNTVSRNNIFHIWKPHWAAIDHGSGYGNDVDYDLFNGQVNAGPGAEIHGIRAEPVYQADNGPASGSGGMYQLAPSSPGFGNAVRIPNFNDADAAPDIGAHQHGTPAMTFGVNGGR